MTFDEMERALNTLLETQQMMGRNIQALFEVASANTTQIEANTKGLAAIEKHFIALQNEIRNYIRGLRNGGRSSE